VLGLKCSAFKKPSLGLKEKSVINGVLCDKQMHNISASLSIMSLDHCRHCPIDNMALVMHSYCFPHSPAPKHAGSLVVKYNGIQPEIEHTSNSLAV